MHIQTNTSNADPTQSSVLLNYSEFEALIDKKEELEAFIYDSELLAMPFGGCLLIRKDEDKLEIYDLTSHHRMDISYQGCLQLLHNLHTLDRFCSMFLDGRFHRILKHNKLL